MTSHFSRAQTQQGTQPHSSSFWASTSRPAPKLPRLDRSVGTDVVVIGAGFTGLNAAWELAERGVASIVLEANEVGWGASGRNGGMAVLRYKKFWSVLARQLGNEATRHLYTQVQEGLATLERNVLDLSIDCDFKRFGHITAANGMRALQALEADCQWLAAEAKDSTPYILNATEAGALIGTDVYSGAYVDSRSAGIHPLNYCRGFAAALIAKGVSIYGHSPAVEIAVEQNHVVVRTPDGEVRAHQVLLCTNAYTGVFDLCGDLTQRMVTVSAAVVATGSLSEDVLRSILPQRHLVTDTRNLVNYFRLLPGNRILFGGRGSLTGKEAPHHYDGLIKQLHRTFPKLAPVPIEHRWSGKVAITLDSFPHIGAVGDRVFYAAGYGGRGVVLANLLGKHLAQYALGEPVQLGTMSQSAFRPIPFNRLRIPIMNSVAVYYKIRDRFQI